MDLSSKNIVGAIDSTFFLFDNLQILNLNDNALTGNIPDCLGKSRNLRYLYLANNFLSGNLPPSMETLYNKTNANIILTGNNMNGLIPFGLYSDKKSSFFFDNRYTYFPEEEISFDYGYGLYFSDEPIYPLSDR